MKLLQDYAWPGNVRELENCLRSAAALCRLDVILPDDLPAEIHRGNLAAPTDAIGTGDRFQVRSARYCERGDCRRRKSGLYDEVVATLDKALIELVLDAFSGNHSRTADLLGMSRTTPFEED